MSLLPSEEALVSRLRALRPEDHRSIVEHLGLSLGEFDVVIAMPQALDLAAHLARSRGTEVVTAERGEESGQWTLLPGAPESVQRAVLLTDHFQDGLGELEVVLQAAKQGYLVDAVACAVERTNDRGRSRLELQGLQVRAVAQVADTPRGLVLERRIPS